MSNVRLGYNYINVARYTLSYYFVQHFGFKLAGVVQHFGKYAYFPCLLRVRSENCYHFHVGSVN